MENTENETVEIKRVLVTGASGGIGRAIAVACAKAGYYVICHYNGSEAKAQETLDMVKAAGADGEILQFNVSDRADCEAKLKEVALKYGALWGIVNNAGITRDNIFAAMKGDDWDAVVNTNLGSFYNVIKPLIMPMIGRKNKRGGRIVNISSIVGVHGNGGQTNYSAAKAGLIGASKSLALELASRGITVNAIAPGFIDTDMTKAIRPEAAEAMIKAIPMGRAGQPEEIGAVAAFLLSEGASYITGQVLEVSGGLTS